MQCLGDTWFSWDAMCETDLRSGLEEFLSGKNYSIYCILGTDYGRQFLGIWSTSSQAEECLPNRPHPTPTGCQGRPRAHTFLFTSPSGQVITFSLSQKIISQPHLVLQWFLSLLNLCSKISLCNSHKLIWTKPFGKEPVWSVELSCFHLRVIQL